MFRLAPFDGARCGYGQIVGTYGSSGGHLHIGIFKRWYRGSEAGVDEVTDDAFALLARSTDAMLHHGHWQVIGTATVRPVALPEEGEVMAPIRLQHAFEALIGARPWQPVYDRLRA